MICFNLFKIQPFLKSFLFDIPIFSKLLYRRIGSIQILKLFDMIFVLTLAKWIPLIIHIYYEVHYKRLQYNIRTTSPTRVTDTFQLTNTFLNR